MKKKINLLLIFLLIIPWISLIENKEAFVNDGYDSNIIRESSTVLTGDLNYLDENDYIIQSLSWSGLSLFNITCSSTGSADLVFFFTSSQNRYSYYSDKESMIWSDNFLKTYGKPLWSENWDTWSLNDDINSGVEVSAGQSKSFLLSIGEGDSFDVKIFILLIQTTNSSKNSYNIDIINLPDSNVFESISIGDENTTNFCVPAKGYKLFNFESAISSNDVILYDEMIINNSFSWIYWRDTLTNLWSPIEENFTENTSREWLPLFNNFNLTSRSAIGIIFNLAETDLNFSYTSRLSLESSNRTKMSTFTETSTLTTQFSLNENITDSYYVLEIDSKGFYDAVFQVNLNWSISVDLYSLGTNHGRKAKINTQGINGDEKISIFYAPTSNLFQDKDTAAFIEQDNGGRGWYAINGTSYPEVSKINELSSLVGFKISALNNGINPEVNITVQIIPRNITDFSNGEVIGIGKTNKGTETGEFPFFQVKKFDTKNWRRYQWALQAYNQTPLVEDLFWFCGVEGSNYVNDMNNSLYSPQINNTNNFSNLGLEVKISYELSRAFSNDLFSIYIQNETHRELLDQFSGSSGGEILFLKNISHWVGYDFSIEFNLLTNSFGTDVGITIDDFKIKGNSSLIIYENDFESTLKDWIHIDHSGKTDLWHISIEETNINRPVVDVVYYESMYSMIGEKPSIMGTGAYPKIFFGKDPKVQPILTSYLVFYADGPIESNFSIQLSREIYDPISLNSNQIEFTNNFTYYEPEQQGNEVINISKTLDRPRWFYVINLENLNYLITELTENSVLQEHDSILISFYDEFGQTPFTVSYSEIHTLYRGLSLYSQIETSGMMIISITGLNYNDYIDINIHGTQISGLDWEPIIITILALCSIVFASFSFLIYRKYSRISKNYTSLKSDYDKSVRNSKIKPSKEAEKMNTPPFTSSIDPNEENIK